jgi:hypothetical protein
MFSPFSINEPAVCKNVKFENLIKNYRKETSKKKIKRKSIFEYNFMFIEHNYIYLQERVPKVWQSCPQVRNWDRGCEIQKLE